ncbi:MAG: hypothetical protein FJ298_00025 [Planctomycetes bacterium]|nr:hypothetical protein [Planctomycetota bacterium]
MRAAVAERSVDLRLPAAIAGAALLASSSPLWAVLSGPILFGVPHVVGDVRALWLRRPGGFGGSVALCVGLALLAMTGLRVATLSGAGIPVEAELACGVAAVGCAALGGARDRRTRRVWTLGVAFLGGCALMAARETLLVLAHAHNLAALALWMAWSRDRRTSRVVGACYVLGALSVTCLSSAGVADRAIGAFDGARMVSELAPGLEPALGDALVRGFAFAQLVHYGIWSWQLPGGARANLREDLGAIGLGVCVLACIGVPLCGVVAPIETRSIYLQLAIAHGWIELSVIAFLLARSSAPRAP